jgi:hypothetical protein
MYKNIAEKRTNKKSAVECPANWMPIDTSRGEAFSESRNVAIYLMRQVRGDGLRQMTEQVQMRNYCSTSSFI